jgi:hypothetical protein
MPLQGLVTIDMIMRTQQYAEAAQPVAFNPVGQIVGRMNQLTPVRSVISQLIDEYFEAVERLEDLMPDDA